LNIGPAGEAASPAGCEPKHCFEAVSPDEPRPTRVRIAGSSDGDRRLFWKSRRILYGLRESLRHQRKRPPKIIMGVYFCCEGKPNAVLIELISCYAKTRTRP
jgi:hypothetical protein